MLVTQALNVLYDISKQIATPYLNYFQTLLKTISTKEHHLWVEHFVTSYLPKYRDTETSNTFHDHPL